MSANETRPTGDGAGSRLTGDQTSGDIAILRAEPPGDADLTHFQARVVADALQEAEAVYWLRRAKAFEQSRPRPGDYPGKATAADMRARDQRLAATALACRQRAVVANYRRVTP